MMEWASIALRLLECADVRRALIGMEQRLPTDPENLLDRLAAEIRVLLVDVARGAAGVIEPDEGRRCVGQRAKTLLALTHGLLSSLALGDVPSDLRRADETPLTIPNR